MRAITVHGVVVLVFMMAMYALEGRHRRYVAAFALRRYAATRRPSAGAPAHPAH